MKDFMTHEEVNQLLKVGYDMPRGWKSGNKSPTWHIKVFNMWRLMWIRCYDPLSSNYKYYVDSIIHDDFRIFSNYLKWVQSQSRFEEFCSTCDYIIWTIDKDMKVKGNRNYYPEFMTLCTKEENCQERSGRLGTPNPSKPIIGINKNDNTILIFKSTRETVERGFDSRNVNNCLKGRKKSHKGYKWFYFDMNDRRSF